MSRVEETGEITRAIEEGTISNFKKAFWAKASREMSGPIQIEIAKSLAQLADDIHCLREKISKWLEEDEAPAHTCKDCVHYRRKMTDTYNYIFHWCDYKDCAIKECRLNHPCGDFEEAKEEEAES